MKTTRMAGNFPASCLCRTARTHRDCAYCGCGGPCTHICGVCKQAGIDGPVIRGTSRVVCAEHRRLCALRRAVQAKIG
jgi:hypothetical protein